MTPERWDRVKTLFAEVLELPEDRREAYLRNACGGDEEVRSELDSLLRSAEEAGDFLNQPAMGHETVTIETGAREFPKAGDRLGIYLIVQKIGEGGMGSVYQALRNDGEFRKLVAVKVLKRGMDSDHILRRFENEKQILAHFDHPNVAKLLDAGITPDQRPYFVLEFYGGVPIDRFCREGRLSIGDRIHLFRKVCGAVEYAHQNLIVHRDLKPGNILVPPDGEPKLLDFGIAKLLSDERKFTYTGIHLMTPGYASPEQIRGLPISTSTDIYSLGVLLYEILCGQHPFPERSSVPFESMWALADKDPKRPSAVVKTDGQPLPEGASSYQHWSALLRGDLDNIVSKAMSPEPVRRYRSVEQLSADLERFLEGRPVTAGGDSYLYLARKFIQRNWLAAGAAVLVVAALTIGLAVASYQAQVARTQRSRAVQREGELRRMAQSLIFDLNDAIQRLPGSTPVRQKLLSRATEALDSLAKDATGQTSLQTELAEAYMRLASVEGAPSESNLGEPRAALEDYRKAAALLEGIPESARTVEAVTRLAQLYSQMAAVLGVLGDHRLGRAYEEKSIALREKMSAMNPNSMASRKSLAIAYFSATNREIEDGNLDTARRFAERSLNEFEAVLAARPLDENAQYNVALALKKLAALQARLGNLAAAVQCSKRALAIDQARVTAHPQDESALLDLSFDYSERAGAEGQLRDYSHALADYEVARGMRERIVSHDPKNARIKDRLAFICDEEGMLLLTMHRRAEAFPLLNRGFALRREMAQTGAPDSDRTFNLAESRANLGIWHCEGERKAQGREMIAASIEELKRLRAAQGLTSERVALLQRLERSAALCGAPKAAIALK